MSVKVIDNFLDNDDFIKLSSLICGNDFPWYSCKGITDENDGKFMFTHMLYEDGLPNSDFFNLFNETVLSKIFNMNKNNLIKVSPLKMKLNLGIRTSEPEETGFHLDVGAKNIPHNTGILYLNNNNGYTEFKNGQKINSVANRAVLFDGLTSHRSVSQTDVPFRYVLNFNWLSLQ